MNSNLSEITQNHFDAYATEWSDRLKLHCYLARYQAVEDLLPAKLNSIIDLGCGTGDYSQLFGDDINYVGVDNSTKMIEVANAEFRQKTFIVSDVHTTGFPDKAFDASLAIGVFEYLEDPRPLSLEMRRVTRSAGTMICSFPNKNEKLKQKGSLLHRFLRALKVRFTPRNKSKIVGVPDGYRKSSAIRHRTFDPAMILELFEEVDASQVTFTYANFRVIYYWCGLDSIRTLDEKLSAYISKHNLGRHFSPYASVIVAAIKNK